MPDSISKLDLSELKLFHEIILSEIKKRTCQSKQEHLLAEIKMLCAKEGVAFKELISLEETMGAQILKTAKRAKKTSGVKQSKKPLRPVYFHRTDSGKSWSGRGRKPEWVMAWIEQGKDIEKLKIRPGKK
ncbi:H-NS histone family protein [Saezia sanguinis]|uniref:H-NS histone family protein n=1 Tax=Saezia sanguinis TaxID=1965230 RepID=UPI003039FDEE